jgi:hypothetical protein
MVINNIDLIKPLLNFSEKGDFYMLYVFKRKKDQPEGERDNHQSVRTIKTYCIESVDHLEKRYDEIIQLCEMFKARAYIHIQKQNHSEVSLNMLADLAIRIKNGSHNQKGLFDSVVGQIKGLEKRWIVDVDSTSQHTQNMISNIIEMVKPNDGSKIIAKIPTKNGVHLITKRFDVMEFNKQLKERGEEIPDIQKKNPTLLYYPKL